MDRLCTYTVRPWVGRRQQPELPGVPVWRFPLFCWFPREEHVFPKAEGRRLRILSSSINPTFQVTLLLRATLRVRLCDALFPSRRLDLPEAHFRYVSTWPPAGQRFALPWRTGVFAWSCSGRGFFWQSWRLVFTSSPWIYSPETWCSSSSAPKRIFFFGSPCTLRDFIAVTSSLYFDVTSSLPLHLHVDRGLVRHGYPWVPTDQGPRGPYQVDSTCQKFNRPASGPGDLIRSPGDLGRPWTTLSRSRATCQACGASLPLDHGGSAACRPEDRGILSVIMEGDFPNL
jgi:hypothetical protein